MKIYITRHSLTAWNEEKRLQGWKDSPLTKQGKEDALKLGEYMKTIHIDQVYSSPLLRAKSTARLIFKNENIIEDSRLKEMNFGDYEGEYIQDLKKKHDYFCLCHQPQLSFSLPNGETYEEVVFRLNDFILEKYNEDPQQTIFITIHGMLFTILHGIFLDLPVERLNEVNQEIVRGCSLSLFEFDGKKHKIDFIGKDCFLTPLKEKISYK